MPTTNLSVAEKYKYLNGFGSYFETEAVPGALPVGANSPQKPPMGLYAEKLSGTAFTAPRKENLQSWLYRILPAAAHQTFQLSKTHLAGHSATGALQLKQVPNQLRWDPFDIADNSDFVSGLQLVSGAGDATLKSGLAIYVYSAGRNMDERQAFYSADGDFLVVAQHGTLDIQTELGKLLIRPGEIGVIPRGVRYRVDLPDGPVRGYILELFQGHFQLPELGPIGSNGLANARDFQAPVAFYEDDESTWRLTAKFAGQLFDAQQDHNPFDVVAWHGNYYPYKYDLGRFNTIGSISYDHPDPSIFTVLTAPSPVVGTAIADFVIFPPRWLVAEDTFRPPWYHRNTMAEFMGLIVGDYDAKAGGKGGFQPGGASLHNVMGAHGPDAQTFEKASNAELQPHKVGSGSIAFMFESCLMLGVTDWSFNRCQKVQELYNEHSWVTAREIRRNECAHLDAGGVRAGSVEPNRERTKLGDECKRRKIKCSGEETCKGCRDFGSTCVYGRPPRARASGRVSLPKRRNSAEIHSPETNPETTHRSPPSQTVESSSREPRTTRTASEGQHGLGSSNYYLRLAKKQLVALSPEHNDTIRQGYSKGAASVASMQRLIEHRNNGSPGGVLAALTDTWTDILEIYEEQVGLQYPFIDITELARGVRETQREGLATEARSSSRSPSHVEYIESAAIIILAMVSTNADPQTIDIANPLVEELYSAALISTHLHAVNKESLVILILSSVFFFLSDREILAWRTIGTVLRLLHELIGRNSEDLQAPSSLSQLTGVGDKLYWSAYTLDHRWSFGTGLPFAIQDADINHHPNFSDDSISSAYLTHMVSYSRISSEVRKSLLEPSLTVGSTLSSVRDFLSFRVDQWQRNLPQRLQFKGIQDRFDPARESRGAYRLRLLLYLRANQMRTVIHRKLFSGAHNVDRSAAKIMAEVAQDTIRILIVLARETDIYHAQQRSFNHFLEAALTSLLLVICQANSQQNPSYLQDIHAAMELVRQLAVNSTITRALQERLQGVQDIISNIWSETQRPSPPPENTNLSSGRLSVNEAGGSPAMTRASHGQTDSLQAIAPPAYSPGPASYPVPSHQEGLSIDFGQQSGLTPSKFDLGPAQGTTPQAFPGLSMGLDTPVLTGMATPQTISYSEHEPFPSRYAELEELLKDYDYFMSSATLL